MSKYSSITNISILKAVGPWRSKYANEVQDNLLIPGKSYTYRVASETMVASEAVLSINWNTPEDDAAWEDL